MTAAAITFLEFELRAWRANARHVDVLVHASPAGTMSKPVRATFSREDQRRAAIDGEADMSAAFEVGRLLGRTLLVAPVYSLLQQTLRDVGRRGRVGVRLRLALDDELTDLPLEFLYRPDVHENVYSGFLVANPLISLVRGGAITGLTLPDAPSRPQIVFAGALWAGRDRWSLRDEYAALAQQCGVSAPHVDAGTFVDASKVDVLNQRLSRGADIFHYSGHTDSVSDSVLARSMTASGDRIQSTWSAADAADCLRASGTRFAMFNACNSAHSAFVRPFIDARLPAFVGVTGIVFSDAAIEFSSRVYQSLTAGFSIDEAVTHARVHLLNLYAPQGRCDWGTYVVYLLTRQAVLFPMPDTPAVAASQESIRASREMTVERLRAMLEELDGALYGVLVSDLASRGVLLLGRFSRDRLAVLTAVKNALADHRAGYRPVLFTFERPKGKDLVESIGSFASLSRFIIADLTEPAMVREELLRIVPHQPSVAVVPIIAEGQEPYVGFSHIRRFPWVTALVTYRDVADLLKRLDTDVIGPAEAVVAANPNG